jgi:hypothetical protein
MPIEADSSFQDERHKVRQRGRTREGERRSGGQKREGRGEQADSDNGGPKKQVDLSVVEDPQNITSRELWIGEIHGKPIVADSPRSRKIGSLTGRARFAFLSSVYAKSPIHSSSSAGGEITAILGSERMTGKPHLTAASKGGPAATASVCLYRRLETQRFADPAVFVDTNAR